MSTSVDLVSDDADRSWVNQINACWRASVEAILEVGRLLTSSRKALPHGSWEKMCASDLPFTARTAQMLMAISKDPRLANPKHVSLLPASWGTLYELTKLTDEQFDARVSDGTIRADMQRNDVSAEIKRSQRAVREEDLGAKQAALPTRKYGVILADAEWRFEPWSRSTGMDRAADNHYPTSCTEVIAARDVPSIAADDCVLFLWATAPMMPHALLVMGAWGFDYRSQVIWHKDRIGTGYWFRNKHELLLVGVKGKIPAPAMGTQSNSIFEAPVTKHSAKPECVLEMIEAYFPNLPKIELNRRGPARPGWDAWGNESECSTTDIDATAYDLETGEVIEDINSPQSTATPSEIKEPAPEAPPCLAAVEPVLTPASPTAAVSIGSLNLASNDPGPIPAQFRRDSNNRLPGDVRS